MHHVRAEAVQWIDEEWPGRVEVHLTESDGDVASLIDKVPAFDYGDRLAPGVNLPVGIEVPCDVLEWVVDRAGNRSALIRLHSSIEDQNGRSVFNVNASNLASCP